MAAPFREAAHPLMVKAMRLQGTYRGEGQYDSGGVAEGLISHNDEAKAAFRKDSLAYLRRLMGDTFWPPFEARRKGGWKKELLGPKFNAAGTGVSGEATLFFGPRDSEVGVQVIISANGSSARRVSRSGAYIMWRLITRAEPYRGREMHWEDWDVTTFDLAGRLQQAVRDVQSAPVAVDLALLRGAPPVPQSPAAPAISAPPPAVPAQPPAPTSPTPDFGQGPLAEHLARMETELRALQASSPGDPALRPRVRQYLSRLSTVPQRRAALALHHTLQGDTHAYR